MTIEYTPEAIWSLKNIYEFICQENNRAAAVIHNEILDKIDQLCSFPQMAPIEPLLEDLAVSYRSLVVHSNYKVIYRVEGEKIFIVDIWDCRQKPEMLKKRIIKQKKQ